jgi:hypothetical protein
MPNQETTSMDTSELVEQAQAAYQQGRTRECFALTKALLLADPGNEEAQLLQSALRVDLQQDLHDARGLIEQSGTKEERKKYRRAAEIILLKTLNMDPDNLEAKALLQSARAVPALPDAKPEPRSESKSETKPESKSAFHPVPHQGSQAVSQTDEDLPFVAAPPLFERKDNDKKRSLKLPYALVALLGLGVGLFMLLKSRPTNPNALAAPVAKAEPAKNPSFQPRLGDSQTPPATNPVVPAAAAPTPATQTPSVTPAVTTASATAAVPNVAPTPETGRLAVNSAVVAEIYSGGKHLGSTPTTVQLPVGRQAVEYRHGDLRSSAIHEIRPNATTSATATFQTTVQINANPWAQVFLDGSPRRSLGQTPLSGVAVPLGGVLVFENPNFPSKSYRITDKDSAVQVNFP